MYAVITFHIPHSNHMHIVSRVYNCSQIAATVQSLLLHRLLITCNTRGNIPTRKQKPILPAPIHCLLPRLNDGPAAMLLYTTIAQGSTTPNHEHQRSNLIMIGDFNVAGHWCSGQFSHGCIIYRHRPTDCPAIYIYICGLYTCKHHASVVMHPPRSQYMPDQPSRQIIVPFSEHW